MTWGRTYSPEQLAAAAHRAGWRGGQVATAVAIALAESGGRMVVNRSAGEHPSRAAASSTCASYGPWQVNYCSPEDAGSDRERAAASSSLTTHATVARRIHRSQGWDAWTQYRNGAYRSHLGRAAAAAGVDPSEAGEDAQQVVLPPITGPGLPPDAPGRAAEGLTGAWGAATEALSQLATAGRWLLDPANRMRIMLGLAGAFLLAVAVVLVVADLTGLDVEDVAGGALGGAVAGPAGAAAGVAATD